MAGVSAKVHCIDGKNLVVESGGKLEIKSGAALAGFPRAALVAEAAGAAPTAAEFKALLDALKAAGLMAST